MQKLLTTLAVLTAIATPAFAQSFDPDNGTGNVLSFGTSPIAPRMTKLPFARAGCALMPWFRALARLV
jgi:hypothetical protein